MLPENLDTSHAQAVADAVVATQEREIKAWEKELQDWFKKVERDVQDAIEADPRTDVMLRESHDESWIDNILGVAGFANSVETGLLSIFTTRYLGIAKTINKIINREFGLSWGLSEQTETSILAQGGRRMGLMDMDAKTRENMFHALVRGRQEGETGDKLAKRIINKVSSGRYNDPKTRARTIARTETHSAQRYTSHKIYKDNPNINGIMIFDGQLDSSDAVCIARNETVVTFEEAERLMAEEHPNGTMVLAPVVVPGKGP